MKLVRLGYISYLLGSNNWVRLNKLVRLDLLSKGQFQKKKLMEFSIKLAGWVLGPRLPGFPLKKMWIKMGYFP